jgi:hypothetical protein
MSKGHEQELNLIFKFYLLTGHEDQFGGQQISTRGNQNEILQKKKKRILNFI